MMSEEIKTVNLTIILVILSIFAGGIFFLDLILGSVEIPLGAILKVLTGQPSGKDSWSLIILKFRLPKALTAVLAGAGLSVSGLLMQTFFRNPLAGPFVLGISSGASLGVALLVMAGAVLPVVSPLSGGWGLVAAAILGAALVLLLVMSVSLKISDSVSLLIIGLMFGSATGAVVSILQYFSEPEQIQSYLIWTFGSLGGVTWNQMKIMAPVILAGLFITFVSQKPLNALLLGENYAHSLGVSIKKTRLLVIGSTSLLAGTVTAFCGPIAFIGLAVPHIARSVLNTADHKILLPTVMLFGAPVMLCCDIIAQLPGHHATLPINAITALFGAPVVIWVIIKYKNLRSSFQ